MSAPDLRAPVVITPGEPAGIGPDLVLTLAAQGTDVPVVAIADPTMLEERARVLGLAVALEPVSDGPTPAPSAAGTLRVHPLAQPIPVAPGEPRGGNARCLLAALDTAVEGCLSGRYAAIVTGPVNKAVINEAGFPFTGHTEYLAQRCGGAHPVMLLTGDHLKVALVTTHLPLRSVSNAITHDRLEHVLRILARHLDQDFAIDRPRIMVLGLNPHAGEFGHLGDEELRVITPVLRRLREEGLDLTGPVPADTAFNPQRLADVDAVVAMYHDQGLPVLKHASFGRAVNITLGLPIVRTSVDHGTAFHLAGTGRADPRSLREALDCAARMAARRAAA